MLDNYLMIMVIYLHVSPTLGSLESILKARNENARQGKMV